jgi:hypothetical protein
MTGPAPRAKMRAITSEAAPAVKPTISRIGRAGYVAAAALRETVGIAAALAVRCRNCLR